MLNKLMSYLFRNDDFYRYTPKPLHLVYALLLLGIGTVTTRQGWLFFGFMSSFFGVILGVTIVLGMNWDKSMEYWDTIRSVFDAAARIKDNATRYELLKSMGYNVLPSSIEVIETRKDEHGIFQGMSLKQLPVSPAIMQMIADKVLISGKTEFAEDVYKEFVPAIRKVKKQFREAGYIAQKNKKNVRLGYSFTKKGLDTLYEYASDGIKLELKRKEMR